MILPDAVAASPIHAELAARAAAPSDINEHLEYLYLLAANTAARTVVELGVRSGNSTAALLAAVTETGGHLWSVDVAYPDVPEAWRGDLWTLIVGDDLAVAALVPEQIDLLFIDTSHHYEHTLAELRLYGPRARWIVLHDTELEHPHEAPVTDPPFPVKVAVAEWCAETGRRCEHRRRCWGLATIHPAGA